MKLYLIIENTYFKDDDFSEDPIKPYNKPYYLTSSYNRSVYYYMQVSENAVELTDSWFYGTTSSTSYIETRLDYSVLQDLPSNEGNRNAFIAAYIQMDDSRKSTHRTVRSLIMAFSDAGGLMSIVYTAAVVLVHRLSTSIYFTSLINSFY